MCLNVVVLCFVARISVVLSHYSDVIMSAMASQITGVSTVCSTVCLGADQRKHRSCLSVAFAMRIHWFPSQRASNVENVFIWWRHHVASFDLLTHIPRGCFTKNGAPVAVHEVNLEDIGKINQCRAKTKRNKTQTACKLIAMYCICRTVYVGCLSVTCVEMFCWNIEFQVLPLCVLHLTAQWIETQANNKQN